MSAAPERGARFAAPAGRLDRLDHSPGAENAEAKCTKAAHRARPWGAGEGEGAVIRVGLGESWGKGGRMGRCRKMGFHSWCGGHGGLSDSEEAAVVSIPCNAPQNLWSPRA